MLEDSPRAAGEGIPIKEILQMAKFYFFLAPSEQILQVLVRLKKDLFINVIQCFFKEQLNEMMQNPIRTPAPFWEERGSQT